MLSQLAKTLQNCRVDYHAPIIIGVSGGADSLCLLDSLNRLGYKLVVAHLDHGIRPESGTDAQEVRRAADQLGIPFILGEKSVLAYAQERNLSIEEAAREVRYGFLFEQAEIHKAQSVAVAHNADDQVETILMHLLRGSGLDGLKGMVYRTLPNPWSDSTPLIRPLLGMCRDEIETYCQEHGLNPVLDHSNLDTTFFRNRLRHELIPELEGYIPGIRQRLWQTADLLSADRSILEDLTEKTWFSVIAKTGDRFVSFNRLAFNLQPLGLQRRLIRKAVSQLRTGARDVDFALVERVLDFVAQPTATKQADIGLGLRVSLEGEKLLISTWEADLPTDQWPQIAIEASQITCHVPGSVDLGNGWFLSAEFDPDAESARRDALENCNPYLAWIDLGDRQPILNIRPRLPGDRFQPLGMGGKSIKLSDFMINLKIPQRARDGWPLVCLGDEIIWVPGFRQADPFCLTQETRQVVRLSLKRK
jgi:tRNA(Ile)-lysidine synthase